MIFYLGVGQMAGSRVNIRFGKITNSRDSLLLDCRGWKTRGDVGLRGERKYNDAAKVLNIPVSKIKAADTFSIILY